MKVTTIKEANDITTMKLDELFRSLHTFELLFKDQRQKKKNGIAFQCFAKFKNKFYKKVGGYGSQTNRDGVSSNSSSSSSANVDLPSRRQDQGRSTSYKDKSEKSNK
ncbi:gag-pol polyprotein [Cucumis melo var. makuwa]|uniref:Gag-pol polyprotein n=1 Tax=Cucumis melo var. makuwa TaxID=1194695 RepID=A0A5A7SZB0_CUCMM|nr:gag-pol polyprotein [Cucumis melo var. makuwa]TYJ99979.1 gag-pol polyprotein [Cucumis melo var. makuwa]